MSVKAQKGILVSGITVLAVFALALGCAKTAQASALHKAPNNLGLVGYWSFEDGISTKATDFSGNGNTGTLTNGPTWVGGKLGKALSFDGNNDDVVVTHTTQLDTIADAITVSYWAKFNGSAFHNPVFKSPWGFQFQTDKALHFYTGVDINASLSATYNYGDWIFIAGTFDKNLGSNQAKIYINGIQTGTMGTKTTPMATTTDDLIIGSYQSTDYFVNGFLDEVRIYNRALSATEVAALYNSGAVALNRSIVGPVAGNLISWHTFDGSKLNSTTSTDSSSGGHNGTLVGGPTTTEGRSGQALSFDGTNDYVNFGAPAINYSSTDWTVSAWVKFRTLGTQTSIFGYGNGDAGNSKYWQVRKLANNTLQFAHYNGAGNDLTTGTATLDTSWHFILVKQVSTTRTVYVDGVSDITQASALNVPNTVQDDTRLGYPIWASGSDNYFPGVIDDFRIYNRALSTTEIAQLYGVRGVTLNKSTAGGPGTNGLVLWYTFDGPKLNSTTSTDSSGNSNNGTLLGTVSTVNGKIGQALNINGANNSTCTRVQPPNGSQLAFSTFSISTWINDRGGLYSFNMPIGNDSHYYLNADGSLAYFRVNNGTWVEAGSAFNARNEWHHLTGTFDGANIKLYIDGQLSATTAFTGSYSSTTAAPTIGSYDPNDGSCGLYNFNGLIDDVRIYNRALSAAEVKLLYNSTK